ncbi:MAG: hypothetical protein WAX05_17125, partial [Candidatus Microthrix parvicella]
MTGDKSPPTDAVGSDEANSLDASPPTGPARAKRPSSRTVWGVARWPLETAFVLRLAFVLVAKRGDPLAGDELFYSNQAFELTRGKWYLWPNTLLQSFVGHPTAAHPPLTSTMLAPVAGLTGAAPLALRLAMVLLGVVVVLLIGRLALEIAG